MALTTCNPGGKHFEGRAEAFVHLLRNHTGKGRTVLCECGRWRAVTDSDAQKINMDVGARSCFGKKAYVDEATALQAMRKRDFDGRVYACGMCLRWHMTKQS